MNLLCVWEAVSRMLQMKMNLEMLDVIPRGRKATLGEQVWMTKK